MYPERPNLDTYANLLSALADYKDNLARAEYEYEKEVATNVRKALSGGAKTKEIDSVKVLGNSDADAKKLSKMKEKIFDLKKSVILTNGSIIWWQANKELYINDAIQQGRTGFDKLANIAEEEE